MTLKPYPKYKESGVAWLGDVPERWEVCGLKHSFEIVGGSTPKSDKDEYWDGDIVWVSPADLSKLSSPYIADSIRKITRAGLESCGTTLVPAGAIILSTRAPIGSLAIAHTELCTNQGCKALVSLSNLSSEYFAYTLSIASEELNIRGRGTTFLELSGTELGAFKTCVPSATEQTAIAAFLDRETGKIDELIAEQEKLIALLAEKRQATISHAVTKGLNPDAPMKDSGVEWLGQIPAHWAVKRIGHAFSEIVESGNDELPVLSVSIHTGVSDSELDDDELDRKVVRSEDRSKYKQVKPGDLVYNMMRAWQGGFGTVQVSGMVSPAYVVARPKSEIHTQFVEYLLRTSNAVQEMKRYSRGVTDFRLRLYWDEFKSLFIQLPDCHEQETILDFIAGEISRFDNLSNEANRVIELLKERRTALISAAVTGKIDVRPTAEVIPFPIEKRLARGLISIGIIEGFVAANSNTGRTTLQKAAYLCETSLGVSEVAGCYLREKRGPLDREMIEDMEQQAHQLAGIITEQPNGTGGIVTYRLSRHLGSKDAELKAMLGEERYEAFKKLIRLLAPLDTHAIEGVTTLFAVWNDFLIDGKDPSEDDIINGVLNHWHPTKAEEFTARELSMRLEWMRRYELVPQGRGPKTETGRLFV